MLVDCPDCDDGTVLLFNLIHMCKTCGGSKKIEKIEPVNTKDDDDYYDYCIGF